MDASLHTFQQSKLNDQETQELIEYQKRETDRHKRLRQAAKTETLSLVQRLEQQHSFVKLVDTKLMEVCRYLWHFTGYD